MRGAGWVVALLVVVGCGRDTPLDDEALARDRFVRQLLEREDALDFWYLSSRADLVFEDGCSGPVPIDDPAASPVTAMPIARAQRSPAVRWIGPRTHLRVRGRGGAMRLRLWGAVDLTRLMTRPRISATFDGREVASLVVGRDGRFAIEQVVPAARLDGWSDVYLHLSSVHHPWRDAATLRVAHLEGVAWEPVE